MVERMKGFEKRGDILNNLRKGLPPEHAAALAGVASRDFKVLVAYAKKEKKGDGATFFEELDKAILVAEAGLFVKILKGDKGAEKLLREVRESALRCGVF